MVKMITTINGTPQLEPGDTVVCQGIKATIETIIFQEYWGDKEGFHTEFTDTNGIYRSWKQWTDGGYIIPKESEV